MAGGGGFAALGNVNQRARRLGSRSGPIRSLGASFSVVEKVLTACFSRMALGVFDLFFSEPKLCFLLFPTSFACGRRSAAFAPVIFDGDEQQDRGAEDGEQKDEQ